MFIMSKFTAKTTNADMSAVIKEFLDALEALSIKRFVNVPVDRGFRSKS